ncbi:MAG: MerR family transcriptional regulator, partial [Nitrospirota bacterium]
YWESEFSFLKPRKNNSGQRVYLKKDIELILEIKKLLYEERYTIDGVKKKFARESRVRHRMADINKIRNDLKAVLKLISD